MVHFYLRFYETSVLILNVLNYNLVLWITWYKVTFLMYFQMPLVNSFSNEISKSASWKLIRYSMLIFCVNLKWSDICSKWFSKMISLATVNLSTTALKFGPPIPPFTTAPHRFVQRILFILPTTVTTIWNPTTFRCPHPQYIRPAIQNSISVGAPNWAVFAYL